MKEINHMPSKKDLTEAKIHHMLSEEMAKPQKHFRKLSYRWEGLLFAPYERLLHCVAS